MRKFLSFIFLLPFTGVKTQVLPVPFLDTTAHFFVVENAPFDKWEPQGEEFILAISDGGDYLTFVLKQTGKNPPFLKVAEFRAEELEVPFFNYAKVYSMPVCKNDTIRFMFEMPYRASQYTYCFALEKTGKKYTGVKYVDYAFEDASQEAIQHAEEALEKNDIKLAAEYYSNVMYPMYYMDEKEVSAKLMTKAHRLAIQAYKENKFKQATEYMVHALEFYGNTVHQDYKSKAEFEEAITTDTGMVWNRQNFQLWMGDYGLFLYREGELEASVLMNTYMTQMLPAVPGPYLQLGDSYFDLGKKEEAKAIYKKYAELMKEQKRSKEVPKRVKKRMN